MTQYLWILPNLDRRDSIENKLSAEWFETLLLRRYADISQALDEAAGFRSRVTFRFFFFFDCLVTLRVALVKLEYVFVIGNYVYWCQDVMLRFPPS